MTQAIVTGGTRGIGRAIVQALERDGIETAVISRSADAADAAGAAAARHYRADISNRGDLERARREMEADSFDPRILIANAGTVTRVPFVETDDADIRRLIETNVYGTFATLQVFAPSMLRRPGARFVVVSSLAAVHGLNLRVVYSATKAALAGMVRALAIEWGPQGATINAVAPGVVRTSLTENYIQQHPERAEAARLNTPLGRLAEPDDIGDAVAAMVSDAFRFVTGQLITVDGGVTAGSAWW